MPASTPISGDYGAADTDDFPGAVTGQLGWTQAVTGTATNAALSTLPAKAALLKFSGGVVMNPGATAASNAASELLGMTLCNPNTGSGGEGVDVDFLMAIDGALSGLANYYMVLMGIFDTSGANANGNFVGVSYGFLAPTPLVARASANVFGVCADSLTRLVSGGPQPNVGQFIFSTPSFSSGQSSLSGASSPAVQQGPSTPTLDVPYHIRMRIDPGWNQLRVTINGSTIVVGNAAVQGPSLPLQTPFPNIINGWIGFKFLGVTLATTPSLIVDAVTVALTGRYQQG